MSEIGDGFLKAASEGDDEKMADLIQQGVSVNYPDPVTKMTALHLVAACRARPAFRVLLKTGQCDFLKRDKEGRLASELAYLYGEDVAMSRLLGIKERKQGEAQGIQVTRRPRPE